MHFNPNYLHVVKLQLPSQTAVINQFINTALGPYGINVNNFLNVFNKESRTIPKDVIVTTLVYIYENKSFYVKIIRPMNPKIIKDYLKQNNNILTSTDIAFLISFHLYYYANPDFSEIRNDQIKYTAYLNSFYGTLKSMNILSCIQLPNIIED